MQFYVPYTLPILPSEFDTLKRLIAPAIFLSVIAMWVFAAQTWASANIRDTETQIAVSALDAYPQLTLIFVSWLLILFITRYVQSLFGRFILSAVLILLFATAAPVWFESASGSLNILREQIAAKTAVSDWQAQLELIDNGVYNHLYADGFVLLLIASLTLSLVQVWFGQSRNSKARNLTRIDSLPKW